MGVGYNLTIHNLTSEKIHIEKESRSTNVANIKKFDNVDIAPGESLGSYLENDGSLFKGNSIFYLKVKLAGSSSYIGGIDIGVNRTVVEVHPFKNGGTGEGLWDKYMMCTNFIYPGSKPNNIGNHVYVREI